MPGSWSTLRLHVNGHAVRVFLGEDRKRRALDWMSEAVSAMRPGRVIIRLDIDDASLQPIHGDALFQYVQENIPQPATVRLEVVTTGIGVTNEWIRFLARTRASAFIDLDLLLEERAQQRASHPQGQAAIAGIDILRKAYRHDMIAAPRALVTLGLDPDGQALYQYIVNDLGFSDISLVFPPQGWDEAAQEDLDCISAQLQSICRAWEKSRDPDQKLELFDAFMRAVLTTSTSDRPGHADEELTLALAPDGRLRINNASLAGAEELDTALASPLAHHLRHPGQQRTRLARSAVAPDCHDCAWLGVCRSGQPAGPISRFSRADTLVRKSVFCGALDQLYSMLAQNAVQRVGQASLMDALTRLRASELAQERSVGESGNGRPLA